MSVDDAPTQKVLTFVDYFYPGYRFGGPVKTLSEMAQQIDGELQFLLVTRNHDFGDTTPYPMSASNQWAPHGKASILYLSKEWEGVKKLFQTIWRTAGYDIIYLNSFFSFKFSILIVLLNKYILKKPLVVAPRGEFNQQALAYKSGKKSFYIFMAKLFRLYDGVCWQASAPHEEKQIRNVFPKNNVQVYVAPDLVPEPSPVEAPQREHEINMVFLSRISPIKNLDGVLRALQKCSSVISFQIFGAASTDADRSYLNDCEELAQKLPGSIQCTFKGPLSPNDVVNQLSSHNLLVLPSHGENFGHVIFEALSAGVPVVIGKNTPWTDLVEGRCGWVVDSHDDEDIARAVNAFLDLTSEQKRALRGEALQVAIEYFEGRNLRAISDIKRLFGRCLRKS